MTDPRTPRIDFNGNFSEPGAEPVPWEKVDEVLTNSEMFWLSTVRANGHPHVTPLPVIWLDGVLHFCTGDKEQKTVNLLRNPNCVVTTGTNEMRSGLDVVAEGVAVRITDHDRLVELAAVWKSKLDWDYTVGADSFDDGVGHVGLVFGVRPVKVLSFHKTPYVQTRYRFS
jgi:general stress protein 26